MRSRSLIALSISALAALALAGCSGEAAPSVSPSPSAAEDLCAAQVDSGSASDAVKVSGSVGKQAKVSFDKPLKVSQTESTVVTHGKGKKLASGDLIRFALTEFDAQTGKKNGAVGQDKGSLLPQQISAQSLLGQVLGCATVGTRVVATIPGEKDAPASIDVIDVLDVVPTAAWGDAQDAPKGLPTVTLGEDGTPSVSLPETDAPTSFEKATLKKGDGATVKKGDRVLVQYYGVSWTTGKTFDKTWGKAGVGFPFQVGSGVVDGFSKAVEGEKAGSQVIAVLPPKDAYGEGKVNDSDLKGQTLVFVIDILGVQKGA